MNNQSKIISDEEIKGLEEIYPSLIIEGANLTSEERLQLLIKKIIAQTKTQTSISCRKEIESARKSAISDIKKEFLEICSKMDTVTLGERMLIDAIKNQVEKIE